MVSTTDADAQTSAPVMTIEATRARPAGKATLFRDLAAAEPY
jgi:hypothetical protein